MRLFVKILGSVILVLLIGMTGNGIYSNMQATGALRTAIEDGTITAINAVAHELQTTIHLCRQTLLVAGQTRAVQNTLMPGLSAEQLAENRTTANPIIKRMADALTILDYIEIVAPDGRIVAAGNTASIGTSVADRAYFKAALADKGGGEGPVVTTTPDVYYYMISEPLKVNNQIVGVIIGAVNIQEVNKRAVSPVKVAGSGYIMLATQEGRIFAHPNPDYIMSRDFSNTKWFQAAKKNKHGSLEYANEKGVEMFGVYTEVPETPWIIMGIAPMDEIFAEVRSMRITTVISTLIVIVLIAVALMLVVRSITDALSRGVVFAKAVAAGELNKQLTVHRKDEIGDLADALRTMVENIRGMLGNAEAKAREAEEASARAQAATEEATVAKNRAEAATREGMLAAARQLEGVVGVVSTATTEITAQVEHSERGAVLTSERIAETATAMEEMNSTVLEVARNAGETAAISADAKKKAESGAHIVEEMVTCIGAVERQSTQLREDMVHLSQQAEAIGTIMNVISDIADQTNLLALNAAIEAARAGEAGRGFAVVADEVRKLAEKTMQATVEVGNAIKGVQHGTEKSRQGVDASVERIAQATDLAQRAGASLHEIVGMVESNADQVRAIATAAEEQSSTSEEINRAIATVNNASQETAQAMSQAAQAVAELSAQANKLSVLMEELKRG